MTWGCPHIYLERRMVLPWFLQTRQMEWHECWSSVTTTFVGIIWRGFLIVPRLAYFYIHQASTNGDVLFILCCTTNDPKLSGLKTQVFYYMSQFMGHDFRQGTAGRYFSFMWLWLQSLIGVSWQPGWSEGLRMSSLAWLAPWGQLGAGLHWTPLLYRVVSGPFRVVSLVEGLVCYPIVRKGQRDCERKDVSKWPEMLSSVHVKNIKE